MVILPSNIDTSITILMGKEPDPEEVEKAEKEYKKAVQEDKKKQLKERGNGGK